jgi:hypothetical protein
MSASWQRQLELKQKAAEKADDGRKSHREQRNEAYAEILALCKSRPMPFSELRDLTRVHDWPDLDDHDIARLCTSAYEVVYPTPKPEPPPEPKPEVIATPEKKAAVASVKPRQMPEELEAKAARKAHKLGVEVPQPLMLYTPAGYWRSYPGMAGMLVSRNKDAVMRRFSRRRGDYFAPVPKRSFKQREFWHLKKAGKRVVISVAKAMYECGFWQKKAKPSPG